MWAQSVSTYRTIRAIPPHMNAYSHMTRRLANLFAQVVCVTTIRVGVVAVAAESARGVDTATTAMTAVERVHVGSAGANLNGESNESAR